MGLLFDRAINDIQQRRNKILKGEINCIPSRFTRFSNDFIGIEQACYTIITSGTKGGKTQFASFAFLYTAIMFAYEHKNICKIKIFYYNLEEEDTKIMDRFISYILYEMSGHKIRMSVRDLRSTKQDKPLPKDVLELIQSERYKDIISFFESCIVFSESRNPTGIYNECKEYAKNNGKVNTRSQVIKDKFDGTEKTVNVFESYEPSDPNEYRIVFVDHVSLLSEERGMTKKQTIDKLSEYCVILRNRYKFSPVIIQQQSVETEGLDAINSNRMRPSIANLADSKYTARDANLIIGLFSPFKFELTEYKKYDITKFRNHIRFAELLATRDGDVGGMCPLYFDGAVNYFNEMPLPSETDKLAAITNYIRSLE